MSAQAGRESDFLKIGEPLKILTNFPASPKEVMEMLLPLLSGELQEAAREALDAEQC